MEYDQYKKDCEKIRKYNEQLLNEFSDWLKSSGLSKKTIEKHLDNIDFYINEFLLYYDAIEAKKGFDMADSFLGDWFIRKALWATKTSIKEYAASLKKFYTFMLEKGLIKKDELFQLKQTIKEEMPDWLQTLEDFDNLANEIDW